MGVIKYKISRRVGNSHQLDFRRNLFYKYLSIPTYLHYAMRVDIV
jgi:hypothetical protein